MLKTTNPKLREATKIYFFNQLLVGCIQPDLIKPSSSPKSIKIQRTGLQYLIELVLSITSNDLQTLIYQFIVGFSDEELDHSCTLMKVSEEERKNMIPVQNFENLAMSYRTVQPESAEKNSFDFETREANNYANERMTQDSPNKTESGGYSPSPEFCGAVPEVFKITRRYATEYHEPSKL